jgi:hypothetical protein
VTVYGNEATGAVKRRSPCCSVRARVRPIFPRWRPHRPFLEHPSLQDACEPQGPAKGSPETPLRCPAVSPSSSGCARHSFEVERLYSRRAARARGRPTRDLGSQTPWNLTRRNQRADVPAGQRPRRINASENSASLTAQKPRRGGDSNPRTHKGSHDFESCRFNRAHAPLRN